METLIAKSLEKSYSYAEYRNHVSQLLLEGLSTGATQNEDLTHYSTLNEVRMNRLDKTIAVPEAIIDNLNSIQGEVIFLVISEGWCGDAAQILPVIHKMTEASSKIKMKIVLRDDNEELTDNFLTNGARSIPKLIMVDPESYTVLATWGPRPVAAAQLIADFKARDGVVGEEAKTELQKWYLHDKGLSTQQEITDLLLSAI